MGGGGEAVEEAGGGEELRAAVDAGESGACAGDAADLGGERGSGLLGDAEACEDQEEVGRLGCSDGLAGDREACGDLGGQVGGRQEALVEKAPLGAAVGGAHGIHGGGEGQHIGLVEHEDADRQRALAGGIVSWEQGGCAIHQEDCVKRKA